ncbi:hypothetical protein [Mesorhizobium sp.]|uniref:hypothetical protein n=1 Tax=Mesorhizobium sp. TaxID=1871066 RepID=UPI001225ADE0|nr:hypothetical protein [Mesorhizobium sp.]TIV61327.1 MAG: hypothetical protein E5V80_05300 [Mesorhizobium sp.]
MEETGYWSITRHEKKDPGGGMYRDFGALKHISPMMRMIYEVDPMVLLALRLRLREAAEECCMTATIFRWGVLLGLVGFVVGFVGPLIFTPDANQGPLLGLLITGPLGLVFGLIVGLIAALRDRRRWR